MLLCFINILTRSDEKLKLEMTNVFHASMHFRLIKFNPYIKLLKFGPNRDLNPGPPASKAGIIPLDHLATWLVTHFKSYSYSVWACLTLLQIYFLNKYFIKRPITPAFMLNTCFCWGPFLASFSSFQFTILQRTTWKMPMIGVDLRTSYVLSNWPFQKAYFDAWSAHVCLIYEYLTRKCQNGLIQWARYSKSDSCSIQTLTLFIVWSF